MKNLLDRDQIAGLFLIGLGAVYYHLAASLPRSLLSDRVGAAGFPRLLAAALIILSLLMIIQSVIRKKLSGVHTDDDKPGGRRFRFLKAAGMLLLGIVYLVIVSWTGYMIGIALLIFAALLYQRERLSRKMLITAVLSGIFFWAFFVFALKIPMPSGLWAKIFTGW